MRTLLMALTMTAAAFTASAAPAPTPDDPFTWMEEIEGARALDWARAENARSLPVLQNDPRYAGLHAEALEIVTAKDRIPGRGLHRRRDAAQLLAGRRAMCAASGAARSLDSYRTGTTRTGRPSSTSTPCPRPRARTGSTRARPACRPTTATAWSSLSDGGKDAVTVREFDTVTETFVEGGFDLPEGKQRRRPGWTRTPC